MSRAEKCGPGGASIGDLPQPTPGSNSNASTQCYRPQTQAIRTTRAVRKSDQRYLITVGLVPWSLDRPGLSSGFVPEKIAAPLDFLAVHIYPHHEKIADEFDTLRGFDIGKPVIIEEMFPLHCSPEELGQFI